MVTSGTFLSYRLPTHSQCGCSDSSSSVPTEQSPTEDVQYSDHEKKGSSVIHILEQEYSSKEEMDQELRKDSIVHQLCDECEENNVIHDDTNENFLYSEDPLHTDVGD